MNQPSELEVINRDGWSRRYPLQKRIISLGSAPHNDIVLDTEFGAGVELLHAQLVAVSQQPNTYTLVNVIDGPIALGQDGRQTLSPSSAISLEDQHCFTLGEFKLVFYKTGKVDPTPNASVAAAPPQASTPVQPIGRRIGLELSLGSTQLFDRQSIQGVLTVRNLGQQSEVKIELKLEGLEPECYDIAPGPVLAAGAVQNVLFSLHHLGHKPLAGDWRIVIRATAPKVYPGEVATVSEVIQVLPCYHHRMRLLPTEDIDQLLALPPGVRPNLNGKAGSAGLSNGHHHPAQAWNDDANWNLSTRSNGGGHGKPAAEQFAPNNSGSGQKRPQQNGKSHLETGEEEWDFKPEKNHRKNSQSLKLKMDAVKSVEQLHGEEDEWWQS